MFSGMEQSAIVQIQYSNSVFELKPKVKNLENNETKGIPLQFGAMPEKCLEFGVSRLT